MAKSKPNQEPKFAHVSVGMLLDGHKLDEGEPKYRYFDPTTTQPAFYATKPYEFQTAVSRWSGMTFEYAPENWIAMREGEQVLK